VLFLDDPFGALDALTRETLQRELARLCSSAERPVTTIMITNRVEEAILLSDRIIPILAGPPATLGTPIAVDLPRPRTVAQLAHDEQATHVRAHVVATLTASIRLQRSGRDAAVTAAARPRSLFDSDSAGVLAPHRASVRDGGPVLAPHRASVRGGGPALAPHRASVRGGGPALSRPADRARRLVATGTQSVRTIH